MSEVLRVSVEDMTLGELEEFEDIAGVPVSALSNGTPPAKAVTALVFISQKRENPAYTMDDARKEKIKFVQFGDDEPDPTDSPASDGAGG
jgi:hypothetical protein